jgi:hypothetical protein
MARGLAVAVSLLSLALLPLSPACGGGGPAIDIKDFDTARFMLFQTASSDGQSSQLTGEGVVDNRQQALSVTLEGETSPGTIAIGPTVYQYNQTDQVWDAYTESGGGPVGFGRPYWPQFWRDAVQIQNLGGESLPSAETTHYLLTFDRDKVKEWLQLEAGTGGQAVDVTRAEVEVWVAEGSRYAVQLTFRLDLASGAQTRSVDIISTFSDFGTEVQIQAPQGTTATPSP